MHITFGLSIHRIVQSAPSPIGPARRSILMKPPSGGPSRLPRLAGAATRVEDAGLRRGCRAHPGDVPSGRGAPFRRRPAAWIRLRCRRRGHRQVEGATVRPDSPLATRLLPRKRGRVFAIPPTTPMREYVGRLPPRGCCGFAATRMSRAVFDKVFESYLGSLFGSHVGPYVAGMGCGSDPTSATSLGATSFSGEYG